MNINDGGPEFPNPSGDDRDNNGMSLRDWFAGQALAGLVAQFEPRAFDWRFDDAAKESYRFADAMLKAREAKP